MSLRIHAPQPRRPATQGGFSLVELMVSILIGLILVGGAISLLVTSKQSYVVQEDMARLQENGRFALDMIGRDIRLAGYAGCAHEMRNLTVVGDPVAGHVGDFSWPVEGLEQGEASWRPSGYAVSGALGLDGASDAITLRHIGGPSAALAADQATTAAPVTAGGALSFEVGDAVAVSDCRGAHVFEATAGGGSLGGRSYQASALDGNQGQASAATAVRYFIAPSADGGNALWRVALGENGLSMSAAEAANQRAELLRGVEAIQLRYGVDRTPRDGVADTYLRADQLDNSNPADSDWSRVVAVRVALLLRTSGNRQPEVQTAAVPDPVNGGNFAGVPRTGGNDRGRYRVVQSTFYIRNNTL